MQRLQHVIQMYRKILSISNRRAGEFITPEKFTASLSNTKIIQFTDVNPNFDINNQTTKLFAITMHKFCSAKSEKLCIFKLKMQSFVFI
jgi:hypothetical protein